MATLKSALAPLTKHEDSLSFDLINGKQGVSLDPSKSVDEEVIRLVKGTGMEAIPWTKYTERQGEDQGFWTVHGRTLCCLISLSMLRIGFGLHAIAHS